MQDYEAGLLRYLIDTIVFFENRYGGSFEEVLKVKGNPSLAEDRDWIWAREGKEWQSLEYELDKL